MILSYHIISYHIISYHIISYHIISYHIISYHIISYHIISYHIISYHIDQIPDHTMWTQSLEDGVAGLRDPPLIQLENESGKAYVPMLTTFHAGNSADVKQAENVEDRLLSLCSTTTYTLQSFEAGPKSYLPMCLFKSKCFLSSDSLIT